jgi:alkanesulfonate monooxygenase SsuD/methylene tetrahydromethanopterin reductase-like flavin-dependent oxidoreductase (luciferase family)
VHYGHDLRFGVFITPNAADARKILDLARLAEREHLDLVTFQDHPYQRRFLDAWTLLAMVAAQTDRIYLSPNVANLPLRLPVTIAKAAASIDILSQGRMHLGLGAGAFWDRIEGVGGPRRTPGESVEALSEAIDVIRAFWSDGDGAGGIDYEGEHYRLSGADAGPVPAEPIEIWLGAYKPRMLRLTGRKADGWLVSVGGAPPEKLGEMTAVIDAAAEEAGRDPKLIRRLYNVDATLDARQLARLYEEHGISAFILMTDEPDEIKRFAHETAAMVRELVP